MHVLTLTTIGPLSLEARPLVQAVAALPPPPVPGLRARHWAVEANGCALRGRYLFDDGTFEAFARDPSTDDAVRLLAADPRMSALRALEVEHLAADEIVLERPVFIVSAPRAGSTLLAETLAWAAGLWTPSAEGRGPIEGIAKLHPALRGYDSHGLDERDVDPATVRTLRAAYLAELRDRDGRRWLELPAAERPGHPRLLDKTPENALRIPFLRGAFPDARFVFLHREMRPNVSSILAGWRHDGFVNVPDLPGWDRRSWCFLLPRGWRSLNGRSLSDVAAVQWRRANEEALHALEPLSRDRWTSLSYSELVIAPNPTIRRLCAFLQIEVDPVLADLISRDLPLSSTTTSPPSPIKWRSNPELRQSSFDHLGLISARLRNIDNAPVLPAPASQLPKLPFACLLADLPPEPMHDGKVYRVHPGTQVQIGASVPLGLTSRARFRERFVPDLPLVWVEDPVTRALQPFWAERSDVAALRRLVPGATPPDGLLEPLAGRLVAAGVLLEPGEVDRLEAEGAARTVAASTEFATARFTRLRGVLHRAQVQALARYYRRLVDSGAWRLGDGQVALRHGWHNEPMARFYQHQLTWFVGQVAGEPVKPAYAYSSAYRGGATLDPHIDREQCEFTVSFLIDQSGAVEQEPWPLWFSGPHGKVSVTLEPGDAVLFRGCELPHWRAPAPAEWAQTMLLFHYVAADFPRVLA